LPFSSISRRHPGTTAGLTTGNRNGNDSGFVSDSSHGSIVLLWKIMRKVFGTLRLYVVAPIALAMIIAGVVGGGSS